MPQRLPSLGGRLSCGQICLPISHFSAYAHKTSPVSVGNRGHLHFQLLFCKNFLDGGGQLARIYTALGFTSPRSFALTVCAAVVAVIVLKCLTNLWLARIERNYIYDLYRTLSRRLYVTYHDRGLPFVKSSNSAVLARNVNVVCLAFTAGVLKPAAAIAAEALLLALKPFLRKERQEKIDRALHAARLASLASLALKNRGRGPGAKETP